MEKKIDFNISDYVYIRLTDKGRIILALHQKQNKFQYPCYQEDMDGWSKWQMFDVMNIFGQHIKMGFDTPFETNIKIGIWGE